MAGRVVTRRPFVRGAKRKSQWVASADQGVVSLTSGASQILQSNATLGTTTIIRTRGLISVAPSAVTADIDIQGAFGMGIVSDQAFAAGAGSIPGPWTDQDWGGWFLWIPFFNALEVGAAPSSVELYMPNSVFHFDSKAMRKVEINETVVVMIESQAGAAQVVSPFRMLVKLA